jgi:phosphatidylserine decarboxylase
VEAFAVRPQMTRDNTLVACPSIPVFQSALLPIQIPTWACPMRIASDGYRFLVPLAVLSVLSALLGWTAAAVVLILLFLFVLNFFRDPDRAIPEDTGLIVSPADGKVVHIGPSGSQQRISIFLSVFDVHINRSPVAGTVEKVTHQPGKFKAAFDASASVENEQTLVDVVTDFGHVRVSLIAGLIARRIVTWIAPGQRIERGERIGLIRFGSRVDLFLPAEARLEVKKGDRVLGGQSIIGRWGAL